MSRRHEHLAIREIHGNLTATVNDLTAWYVIPAKSWSFASDGRRSDMVLETARRMSGLAGVRNVQLRVTSRPYPIPVWARNLDRTVKGAAVGPLPGCTGNTWGDHLVAAQEHLARQTLADKVVYLGVPLRRRTLVNRVSERFAERGLSERETKMVRRRVDEVTAQVAMPGLDAVPATARQVEWLLHRSVGLLMPAPAMYVSAADSDDWEQGDIAAFTDAIEYETRPGGRTVKVVDNVRQIERWVAVLTLGRMGPVDVPRDEPWMARTDREPYPVEWSAWFDVLTGQQASAQIERLNRLLRDQQAHYREHELDVPLDLEWKAQEAQRIANEMTDGDEVTSTRLHGYWRVAVSGADEEECLDRCRRLRDLYAQVGITVEHPRGQYGLLREFIPGEPLGGTAHRRHLSALYAAAALPQITANIGDRRGHYIGYTAGTSRRPVMFDPHYGPEVREVTGLIPIIGEPGAGKSVLLGQLAYLEARSGVVSTVFDPGSPLAGLCGLDELVGHSKHVDLMHGSPGSLNPATVVAEPSRDAYPDPDEHRKQAVMARGTRKRLMRDIAMMLLPAEVARTDWAEVALGAAIRKTSGERTASLWDVVKRLEVTGDRSGTVAGLLRDMAEMPQAELFFPADEDAPADDTEATLLVLTMDGLTLPAGGPREQWSLEEQLSVPLLHLANFYATRRVLGLPKRQRKFIGLDEVGQMGKWGTGTSLFSTLARQSRKLNAAVLVSSQNPADILSLDVANFIRVAFGGRIEDPQIAAEALRMFKIPTGDGYEQVFHGLSPQRADSLRAQREFIMRDVDGRVEKIASDLSHILHVLDAIDSTPRTSRADLFDLDGTVPRDLLQYQPALTGGGR